MIDPRLIQQVIADATETEQEGQVRVAISRQLYQQLELALQQYMANRQQVDAATGHAPVKLEAEIDYLMEFGKARDALNVAQATLANKAAVIENHGAIPLIRRAQPIKIAKRRKKKKGQARVKFQTPLSNSFRQRKFTPPTPGKVGTPKVFKKANVGKERFMNYEALGEIMEFGDTIKKQGGKWKKTDKSADFRDVAIGTGALATGSAAIYAGRKVGRASRSVDHNVRAANKRANASLDKMDKAVEKANKKVAEIKIPRPFRHKRNPKLDPQYGGKNKRDVSWIKRLFRRGR